MMIDGPASPIASPMMTKLPAPMPSAVRSSTPTARLSVLGVVLRHPLRLAG